jgi:hypothetical protein
LFGFDVLRIEESGVFEEFAKCFLGSGVVGAVFAGEGELAFVFHLGAFESDDADVFAAAFPHLVLLQLHSVQRNAASRECNGSVARQGLGRVLACLNPKGMCAGKPASTWVRVPPVELDLFAAEHSIRVAVARRGRKQDAS